MNGCMTEFGSMEPVELSPGLAQLKGEHPALLKKIQNIYLLLDQLDKESNIERVFVKLRSNVLAFKSELDPHSEREEGALFPMMGAYIGTSTGPIAVMEYEHAHAKSSIGSFLSMAADAALPSEKLRDAANLIKSACDILTEHFTKEENILFPMAERMLSDEEKADLYRRIKEII